MRGIIVLLAAAGAGCAARAAQPAGNGGGSIRQLIRSLERAPPPGIRPEDSPDHRLEALGDQAVPELALAVRYDRSLRVRKRAAAILGRIHARTGNGQACQAYLDAVREAPPATARALLAHAHEFRDADGRARDALLSALTQMAEITPDMVRSAALMSEVGSLRVMIGVVTQTARKNASPARDVALQYLGRAARMGRRDALEFLLTCTSSDVRDLAARAGAELSLLAGRIEPPSWRAWWLDRASGARQGWLLETFSLALGRALDPTDRSAVGALVARIDEGEDREPEFWLLERILGLRFGYLSPRDVFDPAVTPEAIAEKNREAVRALKEWWAQNEPYLYHDAEAGTLRVNEEARALGLQVDPRSGRPASRSVPSEP